MWVIITGTVLSLVFLEGLLSADNALVLAVMVRHLPKHQQRRALRYGIVGAFAFRFVAVLLATSILYYWQFEVVGGLYLLYLALRHLILGDGEHGGEGTDRPGRSFWATVIGVELADIAFSIDSILAAVGMADEMPRAVANRMFLHFSVQSWVIYIGGVLGIITMRFVAGYFLILLDRFKGLARGAYLLVAWIGVKLIGSGFEKALFPGGLKGPRVMGGWRDLFPGWLARHLDLPSPVFWGGMAAIVLLSLLTGPPPAKSQAGPGA